MSKPYRRRLHFPAVVWSVIALLIAAALGYAIYMVIVSNRTSLITAMVESASVDDGILADGVLIRDEELIMKQSGRVYAPIVQNGERVSAGNSVAVSFSSQANLAGAAGTVSGAFPDGEYTVCHAGPESVDLCFSAKHRPLCRWRPVFAGYRFGVYSA